MPETYRCPCRVAPHSLAPHRLPVTETIWPKRSLADPLPTGGTDDVPHAADPARWSYYIQVVVSIDSLVCGQPVDFWDRAIQVRAF